MNLFWYKRKVKEKKKVVEEGKEVEKVVEVTYWDCFRTECVVRGLWKDEKTFSVLLNDGHEQAVDQQIPTLTKKGGAQYETRRVRDWFYSQIDLDKEDAHRFWRGKMYPEKEGTDKSVNLSPKETEEEVAVD